MATTRSTVPFSDVDLLLRGYPGELLDEDRNRLEARAHWYIADANHPEGARERVRLVWIEGRYQSAWQHDRAEPVTAEEGAS